jgi:ferredoxin
MSAIIYYFSATGNSLAVAQDLALGLGNAKIASIAKALKSGTDTSYDVVGIVYPVYMFGIPLIVSAFLRFFNVKQDAYIFSVATMGGLPGRAHSLCKDILKKRKIDMAAGFSIMMPGNYTPMYGAISQEKQEDLFNKEKVKVREIVRMVQQKKRGIIEERPLWANFLLYILLYKGGTAQIPLAAKNFRVADVCTKCGICERVCPVENIGLQDGKPVWSDHCQHCMACLQWCPVEAIQYKKSTDGKKRYHHPGISAQAIMEQK